MPDNHKIVALDTDNCERLTTSAAYLYYWDEGTRGYGDGFGGCIVSAHGVSLNRMFRLPPGVSVYFLCPHGEELQDPGIRFQQNAHLVTGDGLYTPYEEVRGGQYCQNYSLSKYEDDLYQACSEVAGIHWAVCTISDYAWFHRTISLEEVITTVVAKNPNIRQFWASFCRSTGSWDNKVGNTLCCR